MYTPFNEVVCQELRSWPTLGPTLGSASAAFGEARAPASGDPNAQHERQLFSSYIGYAVLSSPVDILNMALLSQILMAAQHSVVTNNSNIFVLRIWGKASEALERLPICCDRLPGNRASLSPSSGRLLRLVVAWPWCPDSTHFIALSVS